MTPAFPLPTQYAAFDHQINLTPWTPSEAYSHAEVLLSNTDAASLYAPVYIPTAFPMQSSHQEPKTTHAPFQHLDTKLPSPWKEELGVSPFDLEPECIRQQLQALQHVDLLANSSRPLQTRTRREYTNGLPSPHAYSLQGGQGLDYFSSNLWQRRYAANNFSDVQEYNRDESTSPTSYSTSTHRRTYSYDTNTSYQQSPFTSSSHATPSTPGNHSNTTLSTLSSHHHVRQDPPRESIQKRRQRSKSAVVNIKQASAVADSSEKRYPCPFLGCGKDFSTSGHARRHNRIHTNVRRFVCPHKGCHIKFTRSDNCRQHQRTLHKGQTRPVSSPMSPSPSLM